MFGLVGLGSTGLGRDWLCWAKMGWFAGMDSASNPVVSLAASESLECYCCPLETSRG